MKVVKIKPEYENLSNMYLLIDEETKEAALVDPGCFLDNAHKAIEENGVKIKYIFLTHGHFDHILGTYNAKEETGAQVVINKEDEICLSSEEENLMVDFNIDYNLVPMKADILAEEGRIFKIGNSEIEVMLTPGHSAGGVCYINHKDKFIISGDTLFYSTVGRTDKGRADAGELTASLKRIIALEGNYKVYPGHGPETELDHERTRNIFIRRVGR
ncbi:MAG: MBL fold metallo-hydrolase [Clostridia bacterium]|nr:MBL fold metallo-hydrolase [Clostridia bacterium]